MQPSSPFTCPSRCRQLFSAIIIATASTSGAASRRGCPQRARSMFRTVSETRAGNGRGMWRQPSYSCPAACSYQDGSPRRRFLHQKSVSVILWGRRVDLPREHCARVYLRALFSSYLPAKSRRYARSDLHPAEHKPGPRLPFSELGMSEAQPPGALPPPGAACAGGAPNRPRPRARAVRPARGNPWGRSGRLHAPEAARTGPVNALRRCSSWSPPGRWLNGHNGHFSCQPSRPRLPTSREVT